MIDQLNGSISVYGFIGTFFQEFVEMQITLLQRIPIIICAFFTGSGF